MTTAPRRKFPHLIHGIVTVLTLGSWAVVWLIHWLV